MHYSQSEKMEIIRLVEQSDLGVIRTLRQLKVNKTTFYKWYNSYQKHGYDGLQLGGKIRGDVPPGYLPGNILNKPNNELKMQMSSRNSIEGFGNVNWH